MKTYASVLCPLCSAEAIAGELGHECVMCGWREDVCEECSARMVFDPLMTGTTCGGLEVVGWMRCPTHEGWFICHKSQPAEAFVWALAKGGRSVTAGGIKVRAESGDGEIVAAVMERIARVPEIELENERLRRICGVRG